MSVMVESKSRTANIMRLHNCEDLIRKQLFVDEQLILEGIGCLLKV